MPSRAHRGQDPDPADRLFRRHGRVAQGAGQCAEPGDAGAASRQAADRASPIRSAPMKVSALTRMRGCAPSWTGSASTTNSSSRPTTTRRAASTRRCCACWSGYDEVMKVMLPTLGEERAATYSPFLPVSPRTGKVLHGRWSSTMSQGRHHHLRRPETAARHRSGDRRALQAAMEARLGMRWAALGVDYEMYGKDLITRCRCPARSARRRRHAAGGVQLRTVPRR